MADAADAAGAFIPPFELHGSFSLRRRGIRARRVSVGLGEGALFVADNSGKVLTVPLDTIRRAMIGKEPLRVATRHRLELRSGEAGTIVLHANDRIDDMGCYVMLVREIAADMARRGLLGAIRIGLPKLYIFGAPLLVGGCLAAVAFMATDAAALRDTPPRDFVYGGLAILGIMLAIGGWTLRQGFHRRVRALADLDRFLGVG